MDADITDTETIISIAMLYWSKSDPVQVTDDFDNEVITKAMERGILKKEADGIIFSDNEVMAHCVANHIISTHSEIFNSSPKDAYIAFKSIRDKHGRDQLHVLGLVLAKLHNRKILELYSWSREVIEAGESRFNLVLELEEAITHLDFAEAKAIYDFFTGHYEAVKNDYFRYKLSQVLTLWLVNHLDVANEIKLIHETSPLESSRDIYLSALQSIVKDDFMVGIDTILQCCNSTDMAIAEPAMQALCYADYTARNKTQKLNMVINTCVDIARNKENPLVLAAVNTLCGLVKYKEKQIVDHLEKIADDDNQDAMFAISRFLFVEQDTYGGEKWYVNLVNKFISTDASENKGTLNNIDLVIVNWIADKKTEELALYFIFAWILNQPASTFRKNGIELHFNSFTHRLLQNNSLLLKVLTRWLVAENINFPLVVEKLVREIRVAGVNSIELDVSVLDDLTRDELIFLVRRILGFFSDDKVQINLMFSLLLTKNAKERTFGLVESTLLGQIGNNFLVSTIEFLNKQINDNKTSADVIELCNKIVQELENKLKTYNELPDLKEFHPDSIKSYRFSKERQKQMSKAFEETSKDSIWNAIATKIPLKAGRRSFQCFEGQYTEPMELQPYSHSIQLPLSEIADPVGAARERILYRNVKLGDQ